MYLNIKRFKEVILANFIIDIRLFNELNNNLKIKYIYLFNV